MANPVLCEVTRGPLVESRHRGAIAVVDGDGAIVLEFGDVARPVFPRSAVKAIQALPLIESGAASAYGFGDRELALACASHGGTEAHTEIAASMLHRAGIDASQLECGAHWPSDRDAADRMVAKGGHPTALHNNCSGKHAGFLCCCAISGLSSEGYVERDHPLQKLVTEALESVTGAAHRVDLCAIDGCSIPAHAVPLTNLAHGFARMATGSGLGPERARASRRLFSACMAEPVFVDGKGRACTQILEVGAGRVFAKNGAEGVYCGAIPELGFGIALKCDDGADRAALCMFNAVIARLLPPDLAIAEKFAEMSRKQIFSRRGAPVGSVRPSGPLERFSTTQDRSDGVDL